MTWMQTYTDKIFDLNNIESNEICIEDIAHALSNICRFNGHCKEFYSVAEHCVIGARYILRAGGKTFISVREIRLHALSFLMHDAPEAYLGDITRPLKMKLDFDDYELAISDHIAKQLGIVIDSRSDLVKEVDMRMLATEKRELLGSEPREWEDLPEPFDYNLVQIRKWDPKTAEDNFLCDYSTLTKF